MLEAAELSAAADIVHEQLFGVEEIERVEMLVPSTLEEISGAQSFDWEDLCDGRTTAGTVVGSPSTERVSAALCRFSSNLGTTERRGK